MIRLDKYMADMGVGTRQEVKKIYSSGKSGCKWEHYKIAGIKSG